MYKLENQENWLWNSESKENQGLVALSPVVLSPVSPGLRVMSDSFVTPWTIAPLSVGFPRQECWSGLPFPSPSSRSCWDKRNECSVSAGIFFF